MTDLDYAVLVVCDHDTLKAHPMRRDRPCENPRLARRRCSCSDIEFCTRPLRHPLREAGRG